MRKILDESQTTENARKAMGTYHAAIITEADQAIQKNEWVVIGMAQNPVVKKARKFLNQKGVAFSYIEHGNYFSKWKERLALKLWSGWPTFPQVFHRGQLVGGFDELQTYFGNQNQTKNSRPS